MSTSSWLGPLFGVFLVLVLISIVLRLCLARNHKPSGTNGTGNGPQAVTQPATTNQDEDIWNISSRVNQQGRGPVSTQPDWPTHDHHLSLESFVLPPEKDNRPAPPPYSELDLPSYEQATGCRPPKPDLAIVHSTPRHDRDLERNIAGPSS